MNQWKLTYLPDLVWVMYCSPSPRVCKTDIHIIEVILLDFPPPSPASSIQDVREAIEIITNSLIFEIGTSSF